MNIIILIEVMFLLFFKTGTCMRYLRYSNEIKSWTDAKEHCQGLNGTIFTVYNENDAAFQDCSFYKNISSSLWTGRIKILSDWIEMNFCYQISELEISQQLMFEDLNDSYSCSYYCADTTLFAYHTEGNAGICLCVIRKPDGEQYPLCEGERKYRLYTNQNKIRHTEDCSSKDCRCMYTKHNKKGRHYLSTSCEIKQRATCKNKKNSDAEMTWLEAKQFCETEQLSLLIQTEVLTSEDTDTIWTGIFKEYSYVWYENNRKVDPVKCMALTPKLRFFESDCETPRNFICKLDINAETDIESDDCNIQTTELTSQRPSTESYMSSTEYSTTVTTDYMSTSPSSLYQTTSTSHSTETQTPSTSYTTENPTTTASYSTEPQTSSTSISAERQTISTSFPTENFTVTTLSKPLSEHKQSEQFPTVIVGSVSGVMVIILIVLAVVLILVRRKKITSNKYRKQDKKGTEKSKVNETKMSPIPIGSSNITDVYCDPWQSFEESQTLTKAGKKLNRQSKNPMYELNSSQYDSYSVAGGLTKPNNTEKYENVNLNIYNHCNVGDSKIDASQQNVYDSAAGIYSHLNHGGNTDHNEDTYDHFHGSDQDYDQFERTLRNNDESEYSIYQ